MAQIFMEYDVATKANLSTGNIIQEREENSTIGVGELLIVIDVKDNQVECWSAQDKKTMFKPIDKIWKYSLSPVFKES